MPNQPSEKVNLGSGLTIKVAGQKVTITTIAFFLMLGGILLPTAKYAFSLHEPTPAQLLVAVCMAMFSAVLFLWILDATEILPFRAAWVSKSVYGAAIVSVLGTSVAVYRDAFAESKYPYDGPWEITVWETSKPAPVAHHRLLLSYSRSRDAYWGFSDAQFPKDSDSSGAFRCAWLEITDFSPEDKRIVFDMHDDASAISVRAEQIEIRPHAKYISGKRIESGTGVKYDFTLQRPP